MNTLTNTQRVKKLIAFIDSLEPLSPSDLGWVVAELIKHEQAPGGPYSISRSSLENIRFNKQIREFIRRQIPVKTNFSKHNKNRSSQLRNRYETAKAYINTLPESLREKILPTLHKIQTSDSIGEIGLLSTLFFESYFKDLHKKSPAHLARQLDTMNILIWVSYTIYDEAVDNPTVQSSGKIPAANALLRIIESILLETQSTTIGNHLLDDVDVAMTEESNRNHNSDDVNTSTLRDTMGKKSIAHVAGPLILLNLLAPVHINAIHSALEQYCAARQLLDDLYDWRDDMANEQTTYANFLLGECKTPAELHVAKRKLTEEALSMAEKSLNGLHSIYNQEKTEFTSVTTERIITATKEALASDRANTETIKSFTSAYRGSQARK